ncbi:MAG TPA: MFS transporter [Gaiellaceae bacterium]|nr:MFS transporter [Gaiellaceae bacterium]
MSAAAGAIARRGGGALAAARTLDPRLPRAVWVIQAGMLANSVGTGLLMPFVLIYLHDVRGFSLPVAGFVAGTFGAIGIVASPLAGALIDRIGGRAIFVGSLTLLAGAYALFPLVVRPWQAFVVIGLAGIGNGGLWPSQSTLLLAVTPAERRHAAFAVNRMVGNLGLGLGALVGGVAIAGAGGHTFTVLFLVDAATFLVFAAAGLTVQPPAPAPAGDAKPGRYADVLRDRTFVAFVLLNTLFVAVGYAQLEAAVPIFAKHQAGLDEAAIGSVFLANVLTVVVAQLPVVRLLEGRRRMRLLAVMACLWACSWALVAGAGAWSTAGLSTALVGIAVVVFGLGECLHGPLSATVAADLAPERLRGRYMALSTNSFAVGFALGPIAAGAVLGAQPAALFPAAALLCVLAGGAALALERRLPAAARITASR